RERAERRRIGRLAERCEQLERLRAPPVAREGERELAPRARRLGLRGDRALEEGERALAVAALERDAHQQVVGLLRVRLERELGALRGVFEAADLEQQVGGGERQLRRAAGRRERLLVRLRRLLLLAEAVERDGEERPDVDHAGVLRQSVAEDR